MSELTPTNTQEVMLNNIAKALRGEEITEDIPISWEHPEAFLKAILDAAKGMNPPLDVKEVEHVSTLYETVLGDMVEFEYTLVGKTNTAKGYLLADYDVTPNIETDVIYLGDDECTYIGQKGDDNKVYLDVTHAVTEDPTFDIKGEIFKIIRTVTEVIYPPNLLNLYDPDDPHGDGSHLPEYATYDGDITLSNDFDASPIYARLCRGQSVYCRMYTGYYDDEDYSFFEINVWRVSEDKSTLYMYATWAEAVITSENFKGTVSDADADDSGDDDGDHEGIVPPEES